MEVVNFEKSLCILCKEYCNYTRKAVPIIWLDNYVYNSSAIRFMNIVLMSLFYNIYLHILILYILDIIGR